MGPTIVELFDMFKLFKYNSTEIGKDLEGHFETGNSKIKIKKTTYQMQNIDDIFLIINHDVTEKDVKGCKLNGYFWHVSCLHPN